MHPDGPANESTIHGELGVRRTLALYCQYLDDGRLADLVDLFAPDGSFVRGEDVRTGRAELLRFFEDRQGLPEQRGRHWTLNTVVDVAGDTARAISDFVFLRLVDGNPTPVLAGRYHDDFICMGDRWRFARRLVEDWLLPAS